MALEMREVIQSARAAINATKNVVAKIEKHILPLEENKLWKDEKFFQQVKDILRNGNITEENVMKVVADALFRLNESRPDVKVVEELVQAFPDSLKIKNSFDRLPVQEITLQAQKSTWNHNLFHPYILVLASVGAKEDVVECGGLCDAFSKGYGPLLNVVQILAMSFSSPSTMTLLKAFFDNGLLKKQDISNYNLLFHSCCGGLSELTFQYLVDLNPEALLSSYVIINSRRRFNRMSLFHALIESKLKDGITKKSFKRCLKYSLKHYPDLLFKKERGMTALTRAQDHFKETEMMAMLRSVFTEDAGIPFLHEIIIHQPTDYNQYLSWFPWMNRLRDKDGRTVTQKILTSAKALRLHPMVWVNLSTDQLEEKDPATTLRPFAAIAAGRDSDLNLSYQILRQHPSVIDVIQEERDKLFRDIVKNKSKGKKRKHDGQIVEG